MDHSVANDQRRQPLGAGAPQDAEHVVLLDGDAGARHHLSEMPLDDRGRSQDADRDFGFDGVKGPPLRDLLPQSATSSVDSTSPSGDDWAVTKASPIVSASFRAQLPLIARFPFHRS